MFFIGQDLKHVHMAIPSLKFWSSLINASKYLVFWVDFSPHQNSIVCEDKLYSKPIMK